MTISKRFIVILVLFAMAAVVGVYDNYIRKPQQKYYSPETVIVYSHSANI